MQHKVNLLEILYALKNKKEEEEKFICHEQ